MPWDELREELEPESGWTYFTPEGSEVAGFAVKQGCRWDGGGRRLIEFFWMLEYL